MVKDLRDAVSEVRAITSKFEVARVCSLSLALPSAFFEHHAHVGTRPGMPIID